MFATATDLAAALKRTFTPEESEWATARLAAATEFMRGHMGGVHIAPVRTSTYTAYPVAGKVQIRQPYVHSIDAVIYQGQPAAFTRYQDTIKLQAFNADAVDVTFTHGLAEVPADLKELCIGMVASQVKAVESGLGMSIGGLSSLQLDDFKVGFADGGDKTGLYLADHHIRYLQQRYGVSGWTMEGAQ